MSDLSTNICFDALSVLNGSVQLVENVCSICGASHYTQNCPEFAKGDHIKDKPSLNLSRSSVPNGLLIMDGAGPDGTSCVVTSQKFAKGTRFGPLLAQKSYAPIKNIPFPLVLFATPFYYGNEFDFELQTLFNGRDVYLDTRNENKCNWMIHVSLARFSNEQNLICYQENDEIYYTAIKDIELGDILRVWYSRNYAAKIGTSLLEPSPYDICNNILRSVSLDYGLNLDQNQNYVDSFTVTAGAHHLHHHQQQPHHSSSTTLMAGGSDMNNNSHLGSVPSGEVASSYDKISLPPIDSLMKTSSPKYINHYHMFDLDLIAQQSGPAQSQVCDDYAQFNAPTQMHHSSQHHQHESPSQAQIQHQQIAELHQQQMVNSSYSTAYQTLPEDTLSPADLINISLGASDMNISFDSFSASNLIGYDGGSSSGSNLGDSGISVSGGQGIDKMHSRYSSSTDSLVTLNDTLGMVPATPAPSTSGTIVTATITADPEADKKYPCEICLRKYMTKSNLDKHMRKHNMFLCVFCMKLFQLAEELKDHECTERKSKTAYLHCPKCLKVLSNSWSLQRHMKIHKDPNESVLGVTEESADKLLVESKEQPIIFDEMETTGLDELKPSIESLEVHNEPLMLAADETSDIIMESDQPIQSQEMDIEQEIESMQSQSQSQQLPPVVMQSLTSLQTAIPITNTCSSQEMITDVQAANGKQLYKCIVCAKLFKNPNALEKHLRKVHTVYTVSNDYKSEKKVITQISQKKTSPIKPAIAKALATKLTQKNKKIEANTAGVSADVNSTAPAVPEQSMHVPRQYNKKKHLNKPITSPLAPPGSTMQVAQASAPAIVSGSPTSTASSKSHSIIIISNLELTNNNLIDTSQLFLNQNSNALGNKIDLKVLNSTDKLPKLVPISNHGSHVHLSHQQPQAGSAHLPSAIVPGATQSIPTSQYQTVPLTSLQSAMSSINGSTNGTLLDRIASSNQHNLSSIIETSGIVDESSSQLIAESPVNGEPQLLTLSPIKITSHGNNEGHQFQQSTQGDRTADATNTSFLSPDELSADANDSNQCDGDSDSAQLTQTSYPCDECDKVFPKNYQLKRHMEIHDSTYYMCPYCDRSPLKAKTSVRKHLNTIHPERAPPKEEMNKFISTLVVKDEKILQELYAKHERKIRNKCAKLQAKQLQQQQQQQQQQHQQQQVATVRMIQQEASVELNSGAVAPEEMLNSYQSDSCGDELEQHESTTDGNERRCNTSNNGGNEVRNDESSSTLKRKPIADEIVGVSVTERRISSCGEDGKKMRLVDANGHEVRYLPTAVASNNGALKYMRKKLVGLGEGSSSSHPMHPPGGSGVSGQGNGTHGPTTADNQMILDNLFDNISIENYEFDDNTSIQSYNLIEERFKTSFDQIQEKLDAELSFDEEQLKWQNNLMTNDSSNEIGDKLLNVEENIMLI